MEEFIVGDLQDLVAAHLIFIVVAASNTEGYCLVLIFQLSDTCACIVDSAFVSTVKLSIYVAYSLYIRVFNYWWCPSGV